MLRVLHQIVEEQRQLWIYTGRVSLEFVLNLDAGVLYGVADARAVKL